MSLTGLISVQSVVCWDILDHIVTGLELIISWRVHRAKCQHPITHSNHYVVPVSHNNSLHAPIARPIRRGMGVFREIII